MKEVKAHDFEYTREEITAAIDHAARGTELTCPHCKRKFHVDEAYISDKQKEAIEYCIRNLVESVDALQRHPRRNYGQEFLDGKIAIQCDTYSKAFEFVNILARADLKWENRLSIRNNPTIDWEKYYENTVYFMDYGDVYINNKYYVREKKGIEIINYDIAYGGEV